MKSRVYTGKDVNVGKLDAELAAAGLARGSRCFGSSCDPATLTSTVYVADDLSAAEASACDAVVAAHVASTLDDAKAAKRDAIDQKTRDIISLGAPYDGRIFSMDIPDQSTWHGLFNAVLAGQMAYSFNVVDMQSQPYMVTSAEHFNQLYFTGFAYVAQVLAGGRALKAQVNACSSKDGVAAVSDDRPVAIQTS
jgi:hypothetical protein